jgi:hypothetical protein
VAVGVTDLANFIVAAMDGLVMQYQVTHEAERCERDLGNIIRAATLLALPPSSRRNADGPR